MNPSVSIVMPLFNKENEVSRAIESALCQSFFDFELIIINDGSTDGSMDVVISFSDSRIRLVTQDHMGVSVARNHGVKLAKGKIIAFLDSDDEWFPDFLETIIKLSNRYPACLLFATNYIYRDPDGLKHPPVIRGLAPNFTEGILINYFKIASQSDPPVWTSAVGVDRDALLSVGGFPEGVRSGEDLLTWARLAAKGNIAYTSSQKAIYNLQEKLGSNPVRCPQQVDIVGQSLAKLLAEVDADKEQDLKDYLGLWHRMRASVYLRTGDRKEAKQEVLKMWSYDQRNLRFWVYAFLVLLPSPLTWGPKKLFSLTKAIRTRLLS